jgi:hypothetical protein
MPCAHYHPFHPLQLAETKVKGDHFIIGNYSGLNMAAFFSQPPYIGVDAIGNYTNA